MLEEVLGPAGGPGTSVSDRAAAAIAALAARRIGGEPLQYVLGSWSFRTLELTVDPRALIPRPETEQVVEVALRQLGRRSPGSPEDGSVVVDLGTGSGAIALSIAVELGQDLRPEVWAVDADPAALALATENRARVGTAHPWAAERVRLRRGSWFEPLPSGLEGRVDLVVSNPPYVSEEEWSTLDAAVRREPRLALVAGPGSDGTPGLAAIERVVLESGRWLAPDGGVVVLELAPHQAGVAAALSRRAGFGDVTVEPDLAGRDRILVARR